MAEEAAAAVSGQPRLNESLLFTSPIELLIAAPRLVKKAYEATFFHMPDKFDQFMGKLRFANTSMPLVSVSVAIGQPATAGSAAAASTTTIGMSNFAQGLVGNFSNSQLLSNRTSFYNINPFHFDNVRSFGGIFTYLTSRWALMTLCIAMILNRTHFYASPRTPLRFNWLARMVIYAGPIAALWYQAHQLLRAMKCQTSPDFALLRYGDADKDFPIDFGSEGGLLYHFASSLLYWESDAASCAAVGLGALDRTPSFTRGSLSLLWSSFLAFCLSQFIDTLACALQGRQPRAETGMTLFEHSLAFAEAETLLSGSVGMGIFGSSRRGTLKTSEGIPPNVEVEGLSRVGILGLLNAPPEVLLITFISTVSHISSNTLAIIGKRDSVRLYHTGFWAFWYMVVFFQSFANLASTSKGNTFLVAMRYPTVCIVGFIPHITVLLGISLCGLIYVLAFGLTLVSPPSDAPNNMTLRQRIAAAYGNMQVNLYLALGRPIRFNPREDFYTALLRLGFHVLTSASEAAFLNEGAHIKVGEHTWLEEKRIDELIRTRSGYDDQSAAQNGLEGELFDPLTSAATSGYARERKAKSSAARGILESSRAMADQNGVGLGQRRSRWILTLEFLRRVAWLQGQLIIHTMLAILRRIGMRRQPRWLLNLANRTSEKGSKAGPRTHMKRSSMDLYMIGGDGDLRSASRNNVDVEAETRRRFANSDDPDAYSEDIIDDHLYSWWKHGGWWGEVDASGDYEDSDVDNEDATSVVSTATDASWNPDTTEAHRDEEADPTQPSKEHHEDSSSPEAEYLARLLDPRDMTEAREAKMLAQHLRSPRPLTRSSYRRTLDQEQRRLLLTMNARAVSDERAVRNQQEEQFLEALILKKREEHAVRRAASNAAPAASWDSGAAGMGAGGPQCVVCHASPRSVLLWPCGCLSLCDDCRISLATRNYTQCVCCRADVTAFSRLFVP